MPTQDTIEAADAVVVLLNAAGLSEGITFARTFIPEFDPDDLANLSEPAKGSVFPSSLELSRASRADDNEDSIIEIGIGRKIDNEDADVKLQLATVDEVKNVIRDPDNGELAFVDDPADVVYFRRLEVTLFVPQLLRKRVALSVLRVTYRGFG